MTVRACVLAMAVTASAVSAAPVHRKAIATPSQRIVPLFTGTVAHADADRFLKAVARNVDKVIGLKVSVEPSQDSDFAKYRYLAGYEDNQLAISKSNNDVGIEVVLNGPVDHRMGMYQIDGFFVVKSGGLHQGTTSFGLQPVDEAMVRLNAAVKIVARPF